MPLTTKVAQENGLGGYENLFSNQIFDDNNM